MFLPGPLLAVLCEPAGPSRGVCAGHRADADPMGHTLDLGNCIAMQISSTY